MKTINVSEATGPALDWLVAKWEGRESYIETEPRSGKKYLMAFTYCCLTGEKEHSEVFSPTTDWSQGGPIIYRKGISWHCGNKSSWHAYVYGGTENISGPTPLIAGMRCFVISELGETAEVPEELL